ncbi:hypothetical protein LCGC14_1958300 [marine sediment metagenome]|uniref:Uncharacterized protein n=1 Tax=marine sediment metagenome TaxID=412755 RepID=A0A0F9FFA9_9ZZZZ
MKEINDNCPRCNQYRLLRSINYFDDRRHGIKIGKDVKHIDYLCYNCLSEIDKGIKDGRKLVELIGRDIIIQGYGLPKYLDKIYKLLGIDRQIIQKSYDFINFIYTRWIVIQSVEKFKYHLASLMMALHQNELEEEKQQLGEYINNHFKNTSIEEINEKINEITIWCQEKNYNPFSA